MRNLRKFGELAESVSITHSFPKKEIIFLNTSDIYLGNVLTNKYSAVERLPGQAKKSIQKDDILFSEIRPANGRWAYIDFDSSEYVVSTKLMVIRPKKSSEVYSKYLYYFLTSLNVVRQLQHLAESRSGTFPQITFDQVAQLDIYVPSISEQKKLVEVLDSVFGKIQHNEFLNSQLEEMAEAIFKEWFIDFGPVKAKAEGKKPFGVDDETASLFPDSFEESELGLIPRGWKSGKLEEFAEVIGGGTPSTAESSYYCEPSTGISWLSPKDLSGYSWKYISHGATDITESGLKNSSARMLPAGTVLFSSRAPIGYVAIAEKDLCTNQGFKSLVPKNGSNTEFLYYLAKANVELIEARASGSTFKEISGNGMKELPVIIPPNQILEAFRTVVFKFSKLQKELRHETYNLTKTRDLLLPKLISGEVTLEGGVNE